MSAALFDLPLEAETDDGEQILLLGVVSNVVPNTLIVVEADGYIRWMQSSRVRTKWRWNEETKAWMDLTDIEEQETPLGQI